uniref:MFS general substrate transporter n=1 Tax=Mycena chlorophos TaxID=658473 RepID=A0ABQ0LDY8_MYCCL|nr:predicted protein [Mycena chlorophos]
MSTTIDEKPTAAKPSLEKGSTDSQIEDENLKASAQDDVDFGGESTLPPPPTFSPEEERRLWAKVDLRLMPILSIMYLFSFMDRGMSLPSPLHKKLTRRRQHRCVSSVSNVAHNSSDPGNAKLDGLTTQLNLTGNKYNIALVRLVLSSSPTLKSGIDDVFYRAYLPGLLSARSTNHCSLIVSVNVQPTSSSRNSGLPGTLIPVRVPFLAHSSPDGSLASLTLMGLVKTYPQLVGVRVCLGVAEAGLFPYAVSSPSWPITQFLRSGVVYYLSLWYPRHMLQLRIAYFFGAASLAGAFSGLLAFGINFMDGTRGLEGWSWIFILEGIATFVVGLVAFFVLVDFPATAGFLTPEERSFLVWRKKYDNSSVGEQEHFEMRHIWQALSDWQVWLHILIYMSVIGPLYGITLFLPTIIKTFGHNTAVSQLLTVPPYVFATIITFIFAYWSDKTKKRAPFIYAGLVMLLIGFAINISNAPSGVKYFGTFFCVAGSYGVFPGVVAWLGNNLCGQYKRGVGMALHIGIGNFSGAIASNIYRTQDTPRFLVGHGCELMFVGIGLICVPIAVLAYTRINRRRDELAKPSDAPVYTKAELREMGDRAPDFQYTI